MLEYPDVRRMVINQSEGGSNAEGRVNRTGLGSMKISSYTQNWEVSQFREVQIQVDEVPFPVSQLQYYIKVKTFIPLSLLGEVKRYDAISSWKNTLQENYRHLGLAKNFTATDEWKLMREIADSSFNIIQDGFQEWLDYLADSSDLSFEQFKYYAEEHESSADPFGEGHWSDIVSNESRLREVWTATRNWIFSFRAAFKSLCNQNMPCMVRAEHCYPGMRARPADYTVIEQKDYEALVLAQKWRDRKIGGLKGLSQLTFGIYDNPSHKVADEIIGKMMKRVSGLEPIQLSLVGPQLYLDLAKSDCYLYDVKTCEKQAGLLLQHFPFNVDLGDPRFPAEYAPEMYSGIGPTSPVNQVFGAVFIKAMREKHGFNPSKWYIYSDNHGFDKKLPENIHLEPADAFCGFQAKMQHFGPPSLCTDNPKHRLQLKTMKQRQAQFLQYVMRPFLAVTLNSIDHPSTCVRFLEWVVANKKNVLDEGRISEGVRQDIIKDAILGKSFVEHQAILDKFSTTANWVRANFHTQSQNADFVSDLRVG